jgi:hypothetical protein
MRVIRVTPESCAGQPDLDHLHGVVVGTVSQQDCVNARDLAPLIGEGQFEPGTIDSESRARVIAFQTWLGVSDCQVLVQVTSGKVLSIDHGDCFGVVDDLTTTPSVVLTEIQGVDPNVGRDAGAINDAVTRIESVKDEHLVEAASRVPSGGSWQSPVSRRLAIARWLAVRRDILRRAMEQWLTQ